MKIYPYMQKVKNNKSHIKVRSILVIVIIMMISLIHFFRVFNSKLPYSSDSLFFVHMYYQFKGDSFKAARERVLRSYPIRWNNIVEQNIFDNEKSYVDSYPFFKHRIFYPFVAYLISLINKDVTLNFLIPVLFSFLGFVVLIFTLFKSRLGIFFSGLAVLMLIYFPPVILTATVFMTDIIGLFLFYFLIFLILKYLKKPSLILITIILFFFLISCFNREQSLVLVPIIVFSFFLFWQQKSRKLLRPMKILIAAIALLGFIFYIFILIDGQPTLVDSYHRFMNGYGLIDKSYSQAETIDYYRGALIKTHMVALEFLKHHIYAAIFLLLAVFQSIRIMKKNSLNELEVFLISSSVFTYILIYAIPSFEIRYFVPVIVFSIYFSLLFIKDLFGIFEAEKG